jgi:hydrophobic/amphiphilic exporter-1 (mainly G- bacteria), HAE1 family
MIRNLSAWSIQHPVPTIVLFLALTLFGLRSFGQLGIDENPNIDLPIVSVTVTQLGAAPSELESGITRRIEDAVAGIGNIKHITSTLNEGVSTTMIEFELGTNSDRAVNDVRDSVARIRQQMPAGIDEPIISRLDFVGGPFVTFSVESKKRTIAELSWLIDNEISRTLMTAPGVGQIQRAGGVDREIRVNLNPARLEALGITADMVSAQVRALNRNLPGGRSEFGTGEQSIRTLGSAPSVERLRATEIMLPGNRWARLDTLGTVEDSVSDQRQMALLNNVPAVAFSVVRSTGSNLVDVERGVDAKLEQLEKQLPDDVKITKIRTNGKYVLQSYDATLESLMLGAFLAVVVIWCFLRDWRAAGISALAMPLSVIPTFAVMKMLGYTMNNMSLLGLALVIGILVDDAIVEIENIVRHIHMGKKPFQAAMEAADEIGLAVVATTMTLVVVFLPVSFMGGIPGQFFKQFGLTVAIAVLFSLLVARMLTPLMAAYWMKEGPEEKSGPLQRIYDRILHWALRHRIITVVTALVFFGGSLVMFKMLPTSLIGNVDRGETALTVELPPGAELGETEAVARQLTTILKKHREVQSVFASVGSPSSGRRGATTAGEVHKASLYITLVPRTERSISQVDFEQKLRPELAVVPGARVSFTNVMGISGKLKLLLIGDDSQELERTAERMTDEMRGIKGLSDVRSSAMLLRPEIQVKPNFARAADQGVSPMSIARTALIATLGDNEANLPKFDLADRQINIRVQIDPVYRGDINVIGNLKVSGNDGRLVPLRNVAEVAVGSGPSQIDRFGRMRQVAIDASIDKGTTLGEAMQKVHALAAFKEMPKSVHEEPSGDAEIQRDVFNGFGGAMTFAIVLIYAVLVLLFQNFMHPFTIMMSLPVALGGALIGLVVSGQPLGMYALIGIVMLMGLVTKNAILLVEYCLMAMQEGKPRAIAIVEAGEARMRPILMTTTAMIVGMLPIAFGIGAGSEARQPMALAVTGGLVTSTLLTLVLVPVVFTYIDDFQLWIQSFFKGGKPPAANVSEPAPAKVVVR